MASERLGYWDFLKAALWKPVRSRVLGAMPLTQMLLVTFGLAGLVNPGFWLLGLAAIVALVGGRSASERFQKLVAAERLAVARAKGQKGQVDRLQLAYDRLDLASQARYRALVEQCHQILGLAAPSGDASLLQDLRAGNLNQLLTLFLRLLSSRGLIRDTLAQVDRPQLEQGLATLRQRLAAAEADGPLARSLQATVAIQEKRLTNLDTAAKNFAVIDAELERIEQQARLIREESAISGGPEALSARLDAVSTTLSETSRWMDQHAELFSSLATEDLDAAVPPQPHAPPVATVPGPPEPPRPRPRPRQKEM
jgi:hypothetical protein